MDQDKYKDMEKELKTRFNLLPEEIQQVLTSSDYQMKLFDIAKANKMTYEQLGALESMTSFALLGLTHPDSYEKELGNLLNLKGEEASKVVNQVKEQVFGPIRTALMEVYKRNEDTETDPTQAVFQKSGISLQSDMPKTTPSANVTENRSDILAGIENPVRSVPKPLNEVKTAPASTMPLTKTEAIPVPRAPYAGTAPAGDVVKQPIPMTAQPAPAGDMLANKLSGTFAMPAKETDHSLKNTSVPATPKTGDSYREPIE